MGRATELVTAFGDWNELDDLLLGLRSWPGDVTEPESKRQGRFQGEEKCEKPSSTDGSRTAD